MTGRIKDQNEKEVEKIKEVKEGVNKNGKG